MKLSYILSGIALAAALMACSSQEAIVSPAVSTAQASYELPALGGEVELTFRCNMPWNITVAPGNAKSDVKGIRVSPSSGEGSEKDITVTISAGANQGSKRVAVVSIIGTAFETAVQVTQPSANAEPAAEKGTIAEPFSASELATAVLGGDIPLGTVYVRGTVSKIVEVSANYGNGTFWITDDNAESEETFEIFRGKKFGGASYDAADEANPPFAVGDVVTVLGEAKLYNTTPEFNTGSELIAVNGLCDAPLGEGTEESPYNVAKAMEVCIASGESGTADAVYIKGVISEVKEVSVSYGNATYWLSDDGYQPADNKTVLQVYRGFSFGGDKFTDEEALKPGDVVVIRSRLVYYKSDTPETASSNAQLVSINGKTE